MISPLSKFMYQRVTIKVYDRPSTSIVDRYHQWAQSTWRRQAWAEPCCSLKESWHRSNDSSKTVVGRCDTNHKLNCVSVYQCAFPTDIKIIQDLLTEPATKAVCLRPHEVPLGDGESLRAIANVDFNRLPRYSVWTSTLTNSHSRLADRLSIIKSLETLTGIVGVTSGYHAPRVISP